MPKSSKSIKSKDNSNDVLEQLRKLAKEHKEKDSNSSSKKKKEKKEKKHKTSSKHDARIPMTKEDYEKKRSIITTQYDEETGRMRRVRATGEIMETIVTREQHYKINKTATMSDGLNYQLNLLRQAKK